MALIDEIRQIAASKDSYNPGLSGARRPHTARAPLAVRPQLSTRMPAQAPTRPVQASSGGTPALDAILGKLEPYRQEPEVDDGPDFGSIAGSAFNGLIRGIDFARGATVASAKQLAKGNPARFDVGEWKDDVQDGIRFQEFMKEDLGVDLDLDLDVPGVDVDIPDVPYVPFNFDQAIEKVINNADNAVEGVTNNLNPIVGFVGDVAFDPLTYMGVGAVRHGARLGAGVTAIDQAVRAGSRRGIAEAIAVEGTKRGIADDALKPLLEEAGQRGRGALTPKGLRRAGVEKQVLDDLGFSGFGYTLGVGRSGPSFSIGGRRLAEASNDLKGSMKKAFGDAPGASTFRSLFVGDRSALGTAERRFVEELLSGGPRAADAARGLAVIKMAKMEAHRWSHETTEGVALSMPGLKKLSKQEARQVLDDIENGRLDGLAGEVAGWYQTTGDDLRAVIPEFGQIDNYVNHRLTPKAYRALAAGDTKLRGAGLDAEQTFQKTRELKPGDTFLDVEIPVAFEGQKYATIAQLNDISQNVLGFKAFEDDVRVLMGDYIAQGAEARMLANAYNKTDEVGLNFSEQVAAKEAGDLTEEQLAKATIAQGAEMAAAAKARKSSLSQAAKVAATARRATAKQLETVERELDDAFRSVRKLESDLSLATGQLAGAESALTYWNDILAGTGKKGRKIRGAEKAAATKKVKELTKQVEELTARRATLIDKIGKANTKQELKELGAQADTLRTQLDEATKGQHDAELARAALDDPSNPIPNTQLPAQQVVEATERVAHQRQVLLEAKAEYTDAANAWTWQLIDTDTQATVLRRRLDKLDEITETRDASKGVSVRKDQSAEELAGARDALRERTSVVLKALDELELDEAASAVRATEAQAAAHDAAAWRMNKTIKQQQAEMNKAMSDPKYQEYMTRVLEDGFVRINDKVAVTQWYQDAFKQIPRTQDDWSRLRRWLSKYDQGLNLWKGFATTSPGFVVRNAYSGYFNLYLDGVNPRNVSRFGKFLSQAEKNGTEAALQWARKNGYSDIEVDALDKALSVAAGSGWGLTPQEVTTQLVGARKSANPFNVDFAVTSKIREWSTAVEARLRGSHAYDVLLRGADEGEALRRVEMYHFNYRDITEFDRAAKRVIPFWTFYSRNMALQAQVWTRFPQKLNRSYFNAKENLELASEDDPVVPGYYDELGAIRTPFGEPGGGKWYLTPDLPSLRFRQDLAQVTGTGPEGFEPMRMVSDWSPAFKILAEQNMDKNLFTDIDFKQRMYDYDSDGNMVAREANPVLQGFDIPGLKQIAQRSTDLAFNLTGQGEKSEIVNGELLMTDEGDAIVENILPWLGRASRLAPNNPKYEDRLTQSQLSFFGAPLRQNTEQAIQGELYGRQIDAEKAARQSAVDEILRQLTAP